MNIKKLLLPIVTDTFEDTVEFHKKITDKEVSLSASHDGYQLSQVDRFVILGATEGPEALKIPRLVNAIFVVDDLESFWEFLNDLPPENRIR